jgi:hypothetical protein
MQISLKSNLAAYILYSCIICFAACEKPPKTKDEPISPLEGERRLYIANEGNYGSGNASLSAYYLSSQSIANHIFEKQNGSIIGDVITDLSLIDGHLWVVVNNSNKIEIVDTLTHQSQQTISITQPRYLYKAGNNKILATSMYFNKLHVIDQTTKQISKSIAFPYRNVEKLALLNNTAYVCNWDTLCNKIYSVDLASLLIKDSITIPTTAPQDIVIDKNKHLWVLSGNIYQGIASNICVIDTLGNILKSFTFPLNTDLIKLKTNIEKDEIYVLGVNYNGNNNQYNGLFKMNISDNTFPSQPFIQANNLQYFWDYEIDALTNDIYVADPRGFIQKGDIRIYNAQGEFKTSFETAIGPGKMLFVP